MNRRQFLNVFTLGILSGIVLRDVFPKRVSRHNPKCPNCGTHTAAFPQRSGWYRVVCCNESCDGKWLVPYLPSRR